RLPSAGRARRKNRPSPGTHECGRAEGLAHEKFLAPRAGPTSGNRTDAPREQLLPFRPSGCDYTAGFEYGQSMALPRWLGGQGRRAAFQFSSCLMAESRPLYRLKKRVSSRGRSLLFHVALMMYGVLSSATTSVVRLSTPGSEPPLKATYCQSLGFARPGLTDINGKSAT